jgi:CheY-like chemotaxis protein
VSHGYPSPLPGPYDPIRALIADDDPACRNLLSLYLTRTGRFEVVECVADGIAAIEAAARHQPDVTMLTSACPDSTALQPCRAFARSPLTAR